MFLIYVYPAYIMTSGKLAVVRMVNVDRKDSPRVPKYGVSSQPFSGRQYLHVQQTEGAIYFSKQ